MNNYILIIACFALGMVLRRSGRLPDNAPIVINGFIMNVSLPALTLVTVYSLAWDAKLISAAMMAWVLFAVGLAFFWFVGRVMQLNRGSTGALMLTGSMANTSFIGLPMIESWYGPQWMGVGIVADQFGSYLVLSTLGVIVAGLYSTGARFDPMAAAKKILTFAPFVSMLVAVAVALSDVAYPVWLETLLQRLGTTLVPLALVSVGYQLRLSAISGRLKVLCVGLGFKLVLGPLVLLLIYAGLLGLDGTIMRVTIFEAAMGPMIGAAIVAMNNDLDPSLTTLMVGIGIPLSFLTLPAWWWVLQAIA